MRKLSGTRDYKADERNAWRQCIPEQLKVPQGIRLYSTLPSPKFVPELFFALSYWGQFSSFVLGSDCVESWPAEGYDLS